MKQIEWIYLQLQSLSAQTLVKIIDELRLKIPEDEYYVMASDIYKKAKNNEELTFKQKRVLVNIIGKPRQ